jgi:hypothetical protein
MAEVSRLAVGRELDIVIENRTVAAVIKYILELHEHDFQIGAEFLARSLPDVRAAIAEILTF